MSHVHFALFDQSERSSDIFFRRVVGGHGLSKSPARESPQLRSNS